MKTRLLLRTMLLLCALVAGSSSVWAQISTATATDGKEYVVAYYANGKYYALPHNTSAGVLTGTEVTLNAINKVNTATAASLSWTLTEGSTTGQFYLTYTSGTKTYYLYKNGTTSNANYKIKANETSDDKHYWEFTSTNSGSTYKVKSLKGTQGTATSIYLGYTTVGKFGVYAESAAAGIILLEIGDAPAYTINAQSNDTEMGTVSLSGATITASPKAGYRVSKTTPYTISPSGSATIVQSGNVFTVTPSANTTVTINFEASPALSSIAITTAPTKTTYTEGETFDATGMVVTATYSDSSTEDVTAQCTWTPSGALATTDHEITVSYKENATTKTATQAITVNAYVQPTSVTATFNNVFLGTSEGARITEKTTRIQDRVNFIFDKISGSNWPQGDAGVIRMYSGTTLQIVAPLGYVITNITFTANGDWKSGMTADKGTYSDTKDGNEKTYWTGSVSSVTFSPGGTHRIASVAVTLAPAAPIAITDAGWASFSNASEVLIPEGVTAYYVSGGNSSSVTLKEITGDYIPANTGVVVAGDEGTYYAKKTDTNASLGATNLLQPWLTAGTPTADTYYTLGVDGSNNPVFKQSTGGTLAAGKAYLVIPSAARELTIDFGDATGIENIINAVEQNDGVVYDLQGRRVANPTKGIYIVNGKKVVIK